MSRVNVQYAWYLTLEKISQDQILESIIKNDPHYKKTWDYFKRHPIHIQISKWVSGSPKEIAHFRQEYQKYTQKYQNREFKCSIQSKTTNDGWIYLSIHHDNRKQHLHKLLDKFGHQPIEGSSWKIVLGHITDVPNDHTPTKVKKNIVGQTWNLSLVRRLTPQSTITVLPGALRFGSFQT